MKHGVSTWDWLSTLLLTYRGIEAVEEDAQRAAGQGTGLERHVATGNMHIAGGEVRKSMVDGPGELGLGGDLASLKHHQRLDERADAGRLHMTWVSEHDGDS